MDVNELERVIQEKEDYLEVLKENTTGNKDAIEKLEKEISETKTILNTYKTTVVEIDSLDKLTPIKKINPIGKRLWEQAESYRNKSKGNAKTKTLSSTAAYSSIVLMSISSALLTVGIIALGIIFAK